MKDFNFDITKVTAEIIREQRIYEQIMFVFEENKKNSEYKNDHEFAIIATAVGAATTISINLLNRYHEELNKYLLNFRN